MFKMDIFYKLSMIIMCGYKHSFYNVVDWDFTEWLLVFFNSLVYWRLLNMDTVPDRLGSTLGPSWVIFSSLLRVCTRSMLTNHDIWYSFCISV